MVEFRIFEFREIFMACDSPSELYVENWSPFDPACNDILTKMSVNFSIGKVSQENEKF